MTIFYVYPKFDVPNKEYQTCGAVPQRTVTSKSEELMADNEDLRAAMEELKAQLSPPPEVFWAVDLSTHKQYEIYFSKRTGQLVIESR